MLDQRDARVEVARQEADEKIIPLVIEKTYPMTSALTDAGYSYLASEHLSLPNALTDHRAAELLGYIAADNYERLLKLPPIRGNPQP